MSVPEHLWRFPTASAISSLAKRFHLPTGDHMQDWEWEVADSNRIGEFLDAYTNGELSDDERFTLMEMLIQSFEDLGPSLDNHPRWSEFLSLVERNIDLHIYSVWYWSDVDDELGEDPWEITRHLRPILNRNKSRFEKSI